MLVDGTVCDFLLGVSFLLVPLVCGFSGKPKGKQLFWGPPTKKTDPTIP